MVVDGFNSLLRDLELPHPYEPMNWLRVLTGYTAGIVLAVALCFLIASTLWKEVDTRTETLESLRVIPLSLAMLVPVGLFVGSGWGPLFVPLSLVFIFFPVLAQLVAVAGGERPMSGTSLALLGLVLIASLIALTGRRTPPVHKPATTAHAPAVAGAST